METYSVEIVFASGMKMEAFKTGFVQALLYVTSVALENSNRTVIKATIKIVQ
jgi:hypothetical protein